MNQEKPSSCSGVLVKLMVLVAVIFAVAALAAWRVLHKPVPSPGIEEIERREGVAVEAIMPGRKDLVDYAYCDGNVTTSEKRVLRAEIAETVEAVHVDVGDTVKEGQLLVTFRKTDLQADIEAKYAHDIGLAAAKFS